jgi:copper chaperone
MTDQTILTVNDMTCGHCVGTVRKALEEALPGAEISVDLATHKVAFTGDRKTGEEAIREAGYTPERA